MHSKTPLYVSLPAEAAASFHRELMASLISQENGNLHLYSGEASSFPIPGTLILSLCCLCR